MEKLKIVKPRELQCGLYQFEDMKKSFIKGNYNYIIFLLEKSGMKWLRKWIWGIVVVFSIVFIVDVSVVIGVVVLVVDLVVVVVVFVLVVVVVVAKGVVVASESFSEPFS